jgi:hypothetical protein
MSVSDLDYKIKYLKYKNKYLNLQRQIGGVNGVDDVVVSKPSIQTIPDDALRLILPNYSSFDKKSRQVQKENSEISLKLKLGKTTLDGLFSTGDIIDIREPLNNREIYSLAELFVSDIENTRSLNFSYGINTPRINFAPLKDALLNPTKLFILSTTFNTPGGINFQFGNNPYFLISIGNDDFINFQLRFIFSCIVIMQRQGDVILNTDIDDFGDMPNYKQLVFTNSINTIIFGLERNIPLNKITFYLNGIGDEGAIALAKALKTNTTLVYLYINKNNIGDEGAIALAEALKTNTTLVYLSMEQNNIGAKGAIAIAEALKTNTTLTRLSMDRNNIGSEGAIAFAETLITNKTLTTLIVSYCNIGSEGAKKLVDAIKINTTLTFIGLYGNEGISNTRSYLRDNGVVRNIETY